VINVKPRHKTDQAGERCGPFPELVRMNYFHGQRLMPRDFLAEQSYHRAKHLLINRCLHGYGVVCGLEMTAVPTDEPCPDPAGEQRRELDNAVATAEAELADAEARGDDQAIKALETRLEELRREREKLGGEPCPPAQKPVPEKKIERKLRLGCGLAIDPSGHEIVVASPTVIELDRLLDHEAWQRIERYGAADLWLSLCYAECRFEPVRPGALDECELTPGCRDARIREGWTLHLSLEPPPVDERCEYCCDGSCGTCVLLARIHVRSGRGLRPEDVDASVRRPFGLYAPTVVTGINWRHGGTYTPAEAQALSGADDGAGAYEIRFSRPIRVDTIVPGVVELLSFTGGRGESGTVNHLAGEFVGLPATGLTDRIRYRDVTGERPQRGDRILLILRCDFLLDACCRAIDGNHIGGRVPLIDGPAEGEEERACATPPGRAGAPWTSGNGIPGGSLESWIFISKDKEAKA
jgi:hypothetical protein